MQFEIVTPHRKLLTVECQAVTLPGSGGDFQVLDGHTPVLSALRTGIVSIELAKNDVQKLMVADGFVEVEHDKVVVLAGAAALASEVDAKSEQELIEKLKERLKSLQAQDDAEFKRLQAELEKATVRLGLL